jgi:hypothetical protein
MDPQQRVKEGNQARGSDDCITATASSTMMSSVITAPDWHAGWRAVPHSVAVIRAAGRAHKTAITAAIIRGADSRLPGWARGA